MALFASFELKEFDTSTLSGTYQNFGTALAAPALYAQFYNTSNVSIYVSIDGANNTIRIPPSGSIEFPSYPLHTPNADASYVFKKGTQLKVKQVTAPAAGSLVCQIIT